MSILQRVLRVGEGKRLKELENLVARVNALEAELELLSDEELRFLQTVGRQVCLAVEGARQVVGPLGDLSDALPPGWTMPVAVLNVTSRDVVQDRVAGHVVERLADRDYRSVATDDDTELRLVVER